MNAEFINPLVKKYVINNTINWTCEKGRLSTGIVYDLKKKTIMTWDSGGSRFSDGALTMTVGEFLQSEMWQNVTSDDLGEDVLLDINKTIKESI